MEIKDSNVRVNTFKNIIYYLFFIYMAVTFARCQRSLTSKASKNRSGVVSDSSFVLQKLEESKTADSLHTKDNATRSKGVAAIYKNDPVTIDTVHLFAYIKSDYAKGQEADKEKLKEFYRLTCYRTKWLGDEKPFELYYSFIDLIINSFQYGLNPEEYDVAAIANGVSELYATGRKNKTGITELDIRLTNLFFLYATHLAEGRVNKMGYKDRIWKRFKTEEDDITMLANIDNAKELNQKIRSLYPSNKQFDDLQRMLMHYRNLEKLYPGGSLPFITVDHGIEPGDVDEAIPDIRRRLLTLSSEHLQRLSDVSKIEYGVSRDMFEGEMRKYIFGKTFDLVDNHRGYPV